MPTYGYECTACRNQFETVQSVKDAALTICDKCGGVLRKLIFPVGIAFKGSGFYVNDYAGKSRDKSEPKAEPVTAAETKTDTKSEPKVETKSEAPAPAASTP
ncbi:MAG: FmdB family zinc ribbon protein [Capsulimonadaceae bacterium]